MRQLTYKGDVQLYEENGALFSSEQAFNAEYVIFCSKYKEIAALIEMGVENVVCIKANPERLKGFVRFREGKMNQVLIYVKSTSAVDLLKDVAKKPYYTITYVGNANDLFNQTSVKDAIDSRVENFKKDLLIKALIEQQKVEEDDDDDLDAFVDSS